VPPIARDLLDEVTIDGTPDSARPQLELWYDAGADTVGLLLAPQLTGAQLESKLDAFAPSGYRICDS
jgi:alkanesulfonate monooxygenase SsuD/methylene tetrahydromethanopterin reductase-like flavin-dependent oxidoreductase (luciferase family)